VDLSQVSKWNFRVAFILTLALSVLSLSQVANALSSNLHKSTGRNFETKFVYTGIKELDKLFELIEGAYVSAADDGIQTKVDVTNGIKVASAQIAVIETKIVDVNSRIANLLKLLSDINLTPNLKNTYSTALTSWRSALGSYEGQKAKLVEAKSYFSTAQNEIDAAAAIWLAQKKATPTKTPIPSSKTSPSSTQSKSSIEGVTCTQPGITKTSNNVKFACLLTNKKYVWVSLNQSSPTTSSSSTKPSPAKTISQADSFASTGCKAFPAAIVRLQNSSGSAYNSAFISAQDAAFNIIQAARLDSKYGILSNAQYIVIQYAQAVGWGGRGYSGDINTVRTAVATFNSGCNSNLVLR
jgi:hypothetical protein